jgi:hypothetical protein
MEDNEPLNCSVIYPLTEWHFKILESKNQLGKGNNQIISPGFLRSTSDYFITYIRFKGSNISLLSADKFIGTLLVLILFICFTDNKFSAHLIT